MIWQKPLTWRGRSLVARFSSRQSLHTRTRLRRATRAACPRHGTRILLNELTLSRCFALHSWTSLESPTMIYLNSIKLPSSAAVTSLMTILRMHPRSMISMRSLATTSLPSLNHFPLASGSDTSHLNSALSLKLTDMSVNPDCVLGWWTWAWLRFLLRKVKSFLGWKVEITGRLNLIH